MNFIQFQRKYREYPIIYSQDVLRESKSPQASLNQIQRWQARKLLIKLRRGVYVFSADIAPTPDLNWVANQLYEPSYLSLEYALSFYGIIPERVTSLISITTRKTKAFENDLAKFEYRHIKPAGFRGFRIIKNKGTSFFVAEPEKAIVDFLYFHLPEWGHKTELLLTESYRFQNLEDIDCKKLLRWGRLFDKPKLMAAIGVVAKLVKEKS